MGKKLFQANGTKKWASIAILVLDKIKFKIKLVRIEKEDHPYSLKEPLKKRNYNSEYIYNKYRHTDFQNTYRSSSKNHKLTLTHWD